MEKQKTALQIAIEEYEKYGGELISGDSVASFLKSLQRTEREQINQAFKDGTQEDAIYYLIKDYFTDNFQE